MRNLHKSAGVLALLLFLLTGCQSPNTIDTEQLSAQDEILGPAPIGDTLDKTRFHTARAMRSLRQQQLPHSLPELQAPDIWHRIRNGMRMPEVDNARIANQRRNFLKRDDYLLRVGERAAPFMYLVVEEIERRGMPTELALLPMVESAYDPSAYSHAHASGLWQFIPETGKRYGLRQDYWYDGRRDVVASTNAALDYLQTLHQMFDGDWFCALAAYNAGEGRVSRAIKANLAANKPIDYWSLNLPEETRNYVPRLLALAQIVRNNDSYNVEVPYIADEPLLAMVDTRGQIDLALAARIAGVSLEELTKYNPALNRWATAPDGPHSLLLPLAAVSQFERTILQLKPDERLSWTRHEVGRGETVATIAQRYQTDPQLINNLNKLQDKKLVAGKSIIVPVSTNQLRQQDKRELANFARNSNAHNASNNKVRSTNYVVRSGDTLSTIARNHKVDVADLKKWNKFGAKSKLAVGQKLVIYPGGKATTANAKNSNKTSSPKATSQAPSSTTYKVSNGDSLYQIAQRFKVSVEDIQRWNSLKNSNLRIGQTLKLYN